MKRVMAKFTPQLLLPEQKAHLAAVGNDLIQIATSEPDFFKVITEDESWVYSCDPEMKAQSSPWKSPGSPHLKKARPGCSKIKTMLPVYFDWGGVVHHEYAPPGQFIRSTTSMFFVSWEMQYDENSRSYEQLVIGSFIKIISAHSRAMSYAVF